MQTIDKKQPLDSAMDSTTKQEESSAQKQQKIIHMFDSISKKYDLANRVLSMGVDISWRKKACEIALKESVQKEICIADVACGTGDMIGHWQNAVEETQEMKISQIYGIDPSSGMLEVARQKFPQIHFIQAEAIQIPLEDSSVDILSIAYGLRNVVNLKGAFQEFYRILKPNGILVILEFTKNENNGILTQLAGIYTRKILPKVGGMLTKNKEAYQYLPDSIGEFLTLSSLKEELSKESFQTIYAKSYSANISTLCIARKQS